MKPLISVIVPIYNIIDLLPKCVNSLKNQTYSNLEILLVDDGSTDGTGALCDKLQQEDNRIRVFHKENGGSSSARNLGISEARGEYLGFVDSDDYVEPDMYERLITVIQDKNCQIAQIGRNEIDASDNMLPNICEPPEELTFYTSEAFMKELLMHKGDCSFCTKLIHSSLFEEQKFPLGVLNEDFYLLIHMLTKIDGIYSLPGYGYHVFYRIGSNTRKVDREDFSRVYGDCVHNADIASEISRKYFPDLLKVSLRFGMFQRLEYLLHIPISKMKKDNEIYKECVHFIRQKYFSMLTNKYLTSKNKLYLTLFAIIPKGIRKIHKFYKGTGQV